MLVIIALREKGREGGREGGRTREREREGEGKGEGERERGKTYTTYLIRDVPLDNDGDISN